MCETLIELNIIPVLFKLIQDSITNLNYTIVAASFHTLRLLTNQTSNLPNHQITNDEICTLIELINHLLRLTAITQNNDGDESGENGENGEDTSSRPGELLAVAQYEACKWMLETMGVQPTTKYATTTDNITNIENENPNQEKLIAPIPEVLANTVSDLLQATTNSVDSPRIIDLMGTLMNRILFLSSSSSTSSSSFKFEVKKQKLKIACVSFFNFFGIKKNKFFNKLTF